MSESVALQNVLAEMNPILKLAHQAGCWNGGHWVIAIFGNILFDFCWVIFLQAVHTSWHKLGSLGNSSDLGSQVMSLFLEVEGIGDYVSIQVASEVNFEGS